MLRLRLEEPGNSRRASRPVFRLDLELLSSGAREVVELGASRVLGLSPLAVEPSRALETLERGEQRSRIHLEYVARDLLDASRDPEAVQRLQAQRLQDQHVQRSLNDVGIRLLHRT